MIGAAVTVCRSWLSLILVLLVTSLAFAQDAPRVQQGTWTATAGSARVLRGTWSAEIPSVTSDLARGSWTLLGGRDQIVLEGTWSMTRSGRGWQGAWSARVLPREPSGGRANPGRVFSGTWQAALEESKRATLSEMFRRALERDIAGAWRSGPQQGNWWLTGSP